jgi:hypothetical protein
VITYLCGAVAAGLCAGAVLLSWAVAQHPHDRVLRYFALVITLLAVQQVLVIDEYATSAFTRLATNMLGLGAGFGKVCFFRTALWCTGQPRPRLRMEFAVVVAVGCVEIVCLLLAPAHVRPAIGQPQNGHLLTAFIFELVTTGYLASVSCRVIWWCWRLLRQLQGHRIYRVSLFLVALASVISLAAGTLDLDTHLVAFFAPVYSAAVQPFYTFIYVPVAVGFAVFFIGAMLPVVAETVFAIRIAAAQWAEYRAMGALWSELLAEFPQIWLRRYAGIHRRYYSRGNGIRDGLVLLKQYYDRGVANAALAASRARGKPPAAQSLTVTVALVRAALEAHRFGRAQDDPHPVPTSGSADWATDTAWIVQLAREFASGNPAAPPALPTSAPPR